MSAAQITTAAELATLPVGSVVLDSGTARYQTERSAWVKSDDTQRVYDDGITMPYAWGSIVWTMDRTDEELVSEFGPLRLLWDGSL